MQKIVSHFESNLPKSVVWSDKPLFNNGDFLKMFTFMTI